MLGGKECFINRTSDGRQGLLGPFCDCPQEAVHWALAEFLEVELHTEEVGVIRLGSDNRCVTHTHTQTHTHTHAHAHTQHCCAGVSAFAVLKYVCTWG